MNGLLLQRGLLLAALACALAGPTASLAGTPTVGNASYELPWDSVGKAGTALTIDFVVDRPRLFDIYIVFKRVKLADGTPAGDPQALRDFIGTGQTTRYALDAHGSLTDREVPDDTQEERDWLAKGGMVIVEGVEQGPGELVRHVKLVEHGTGVVHQRTFRRPSSRLDFTKAGAGVDIPFAIRLTQQSAAATVLDLPAEHARGTVDGGTRRHVESVGLRPGAYHLTIVPQRANDLPAGVQPELLITYDPRNEPSFASRP